jgi:hypothetical protein
VSPTTSLKFDPLVEIEKVRSEFGMLVNRILPLLLPSEQEQNGADTGKNGPNSLRRWKQVARELASALPTEEG